MSCHSGVQVLVEDDVTAAVGPAAHVDGDADSGGMAGSVLDVDPHDRVVSAHALGPQADGIDTVLQELLHLSGPLIGVVTAQGAHQRLLGQQSGGSSVSAIPPRPQCLVIIPQIRSKVKRKFTFLIRSFCPTLLSAALLRERCLLYGFESRTQALCEIFFNLVDAK